MPWAAGFLGDTGHFAYMSLPGKSLHLSSRGESTRVEKGPPWHGRKAWRRDKHLFTLSGTTSRSSVVLVAADFCHLNEDSFLGVSRIPRIMASVLPRSLPNIFSPPQAEEWPLLHQSPDLRLWFL